MLATDSLIDKLTRNTSDKIKRQASDALAYRTTLKSSGACAKTTRESEKRGRKISEEGEKERERERKNECKLDDVIEVKLFSIITPEKTFLSVYQENLSKYFIQSGIVLNLLETDNTLLCH